MSFDPEEWLRVADICCSNIPEVSREALLRTALNRAYYAALMMLKYRVDSAQGTGAVPEWGTHEALRQAVRMGGEAFDDISETLDDLREDRTRSAYVLQNQHLEGDYVQGVVRTARWLIRNRIKALPEAEFRRLHVPRG
jgi:hypothetical protein